MSILIKNVSKTFGNFTALDNVSLEVPDGALLALLGPSGSGKTTLLRIIAGLEVAESGTVLHQEKDITHQSARERRVGFVFQHYALFRHMTVFENIAFGLRVRSRQTRPSEGEIRAKVHELLKLIQLENLAQRYPSQLSGGQRQRVTLARALAVEPSVLLLDEPFGSLDAKVRQELRRWLRQLHDEIYNHPATPFVYNFLGNVNLFHGRVDDGKAYITEVAGEAVGQSHPSHENTVVYVRPHLLEIDRQANGGGHFRARIKHINSAGPLVKVEATTEWGAPVHIEMSQERFGNLQLMKDEAVFIIPKDVKVFQAHEGPRPK